MEANCSASPCPWGSVAQPLPSLSSSRRGKEPSPSAAPRWRRGGLAGEDPPVGGSHAGTARRGAAVYRNGEADAKVVGIRDPSPPKCPSKEQQL